MTRLYFIALGTSLLVSAVITPVSIFLARRFGALDPVDERKVHSVATPRWGGIGILSGFFAGLAVLWLWFPRFTKLLNYSQGVSRDGVVLFQLNLGDQLAGILFGVLILFITGLIDDRKPIKAGVKFLLQIIAAYVAMTYGVKIYGLRLPGFENYSHFPLWLMQIVTFLWLVGLTNAVNLIDGLDGLAGGVVAIVAGAFLCVVLVQSQGQSFLYMQQLKLAGVIAAALLGGVGGFLIYNFYPARVFMGDSGSMSLGFMLGCIAVAGTFKTTVLAVFLVPFFLVALPMADMTLAFSRRLLRRQNPFHPDRGHLHHVLLDAGWTQKEVVFLVYVLTLILALVSVTVVGAKVK